jgi:hypothetical protein
MMPSPKAPVASKSVKTKVAQNFRRDFMFSPEECCVRRRGLDSRMKGQLTVSGQ